MKDTEDKFPDIPAMAAWRMRGVSGGGARRPLPLPRRRRATRRRAVRGRMSTISWPYSRNGRYMHFRMTKGKQR
eukprot:6188986-Pleurochrysis_carterae.AAC.1